MWYVVDKGPVLGGGSVQRDAAHLSELTRLIYGAALHPEQWSAVVAAIAGSFGSTKGWLFTPYLPPRRGGLIVAAGIAEAALQSWASNYIEHDIWAAQLAQKGLLSDGAVFVDEDLVSRAELLASRFYREFLSTVGIARFVEGVVFAGTPDLPTIALSVFRDTHEPQFNRHDRAWMKLLVADVSRAMSLMLRPETARAHNAALLASFERLNFGVALLNGEVQVVHLNQAAKSLLARDDGLCLNAHRQLESRAAKTKDLLRNVSNWLETVRNALVSAPRHFLQGAKGVGANGYEQNMGDQNRAAKKYYDLECVALPKIDAWFAQQQDARYVVFITEPPGINFPDAARLHELYGLTAAQAKVTCELARGASYKKVAQRLGISEDTVRSHIKEIYRKTRVNRQADLVRLILSIS